MKQTPWVVMMPEGWDNSHCKYTGCNNNGCEFSGNYCPLGNAKEAVGVLPHDEAHYHPGRGWIVNGKPVKLYAVEVEK